MIKPQSPWIISARFDCCFILMPALFVSLLVILFSDSLQSLSEIPTWLWLILVICIDAGHVYGTLFRTYFDKQMMALQATLLTITPLLVWLLGCILYSMNDLWFWRVLAYIAVFHFIRQQYGFMMIYSRNERDLPKAYRNLDKLILYASPVVPLIVWHSEGRNFNWFVNGDFMLFDEPIISIVVQYIYALLLLVYASKEIFVLLRLKYFNLARILLVTGTSLSWFIGIVSYDNDLIFTATNVVAHGVPYYALIWVYGYKVNKLKRKTYNINWFTKLFTKQMLSLYLGFLFGLAYLEEGLWDGLIWREHANIFGAFKVLPNIISPQILAWLVPLLTVPQATHYVLDAFIWRLHARNTEWKKVLFYRVVID